MPNRQRHSQRATGITSGWLDPDVLEGYFS
jgi:hypothetical protein